MECPMCQDLYDEKKLIPRNLPCGHTFCEFCLSQIIHIKGYIECPNCRKKLKRDTVLESLSKNFIALDLALKQRQLSAKLQMCPSHSEFYIFFCEDCQEHLCTSCIVAHSGHRFVKQEHSVSLLEERLTKAQQQLEEAIAAVKASVANTLETQAYQKSYLREQTINIDAEFDRLITAINAKRERVKHEYSAIYHEYIHSIEMDAAVEQSICDHLCSRMHAINEAQKSLDATKVIKSDQLVRRIEEIEEDIKKSIKESGLTGKKGQFDVPAVVFGSDIYNHIPTIASLEKFKPQICFFGDKSMSLMLDVQSEQWRKYQLSQMNHLSFMSYGTAVTMKNYNILIIGGGKSASILEVSIQRSVQLTRRKDMPVPRKEHSAVVLKDGQVLVMGGYNQQEEEMLRSCAIYNPMLDVWKEAAPMNVAKCAFAASSDRSGKHVFTFGGFDSEKRLSLIERYVVEANIWEVLSVSLRKPLSNSAAICHPAGSCSTSASDCIYILGGGHDEGFSKEVFTFTPQQPQSGGEYTLKVISEMESGKDLRNKVVIDGHFLYTIGGNNYKTERLNLITKIWELLPSYFPVITDNLDSWTCALTYTNSQSEAAQEADQMAFSNNNQMVPVESRYSSYVYPDPPHLRVNDNRVAVQSEQMRAALDDDMEDVEDQSREHEDAFDRGDYLNHSVASFVNYEQINERLNQQAAHNNRVQPLRPANSHYLISHIRPDR